MTSTIWIGSMKCAYCGEGCTNLFTLYKGTLLHPYCLNTARREWEI